MDEVVLHGMQVEKSDYAQGGWGGEVQADAALTEEVGTGSWIERSRAQRAVQCKMELCSGWQCTAVGCDADTRVAEEGGHASLGEWVMQRGSAVGASRPSRTKHIVSRRLIKFQFASLVFHST